MAGEKLIQKALGVLSKSEPKVSVSHEGSGIFRVFHNDQPAGTISVAKNGAGNFVSAANLDEPFIGKGIGSQAYNLIENEIGRKLAPSPLGISPTATKFWQKRLESMTPEDRTNLFSQTREAGASYGLPERDVNLRLYGIGGPDSLPPAKVEPPQGIEGYSHGGEVEDALHAVRHHLAGGGFLSDLFSGPDYLSTGKEASFANMPTQDETSADFFKADRAARLAREIEAGRDVPLPPRRPPVVPVEAVEAAPALRRPVVEPENVALATMPTIPGATAPLPSTFQPLPVPEKVVALTPDKLTDRVAPDANVLDLTPQQSDYIARTIAAETSGKTPAEAQAIASVIINRIRSGKYGATPEAVLFAKNQFEPWSNPAGANYPMRISPESKRYLEAKAALESALTGEDITGGAMNFWGPKAQFALGRNTPDWAVKMPDYTDIGETRFHRPNRAEGGEVEDYAGGGKTTVSKALKAVSELFDSPGMNKWREKSVIPSSSIEDRYFTGTSKDKDFPNFKVEGHGAWFTKDPAEASMYAADNDSKGYRRNGWDMVPVNTADRVIPAYLRAENPFTGPLPESVMADNYKKAQSNWFDQLRAQGHDAWMPENDPNLAVILKNPTDIKSAISNSGDFDLNAPRIDRAHGGEVDHALEMLRHHYATDGYVDSNRAMREAISSIDPERSQDQPVMDPEKMGEAWNRARQNYQNFPVQEGEATIRPLELSGRDLIGGAIAGGAREPGADFRRGVADLLVGNTGLPNSGTIGFGALDATRLLGMPLQAMDTAHSIGQGDYLSAAADFALPAAFHARGPLGAAGRRAVEIAKEYAKPAAATAAGVAGLTAAPDEAEAAKFEPIRRLLAMGMKPSEIEEALRIARERIPANHPTVMWHGTPSGDLRGGISALHLGTHEAARQAINARIGIPAEGNWNGLRVYGETPIAGRDTILAKEKYGMTGYNVSPPMEDYLPTKQLKYANGQIMPMDVEPVIYPFRITGEMSNKYYSPMSDIRANATMQGMLKKGQAKRGYYYGNEGEDVGSISAVVPGPQHVQPVDLERLLRTGEYANGGSVEAQHDPMGNVTVPAAGEPPNAPPSDEPGIVDRAMQFVSQFNPIGTAEAASLPKLLRKAVSKLEYPMAPKTNWYGDANYQQTGGALTKMTPDDFLAKARPMKIDEVARENIDDLKRHILEGGELDPLALYKSGKEDGRHRAIAARELGIQEVPVLRWETAE